PWLASTTTVLIGCVPHRAAACTSRRRRAPRSSTAPPRCAGCPARSRVPRQRRSASCRGRTSCRVPARCRAGQCGRAVAASCVRAPGAAGGSSCPHLTRTVAGGAAAGALPFVRFDLGEAIEHAAAKFEEHRASAEHPPAFEGFFRQAPARGELARAEQFGGWQGDIHVVTPVRWAVPAAALTEAR